MIAATAAATAAAAAAAAAAAVARLEKRSLPLLPKLLYLVLLGGKRLLQWRQAPIAIQKRHQQ